MNSMKTNLIDRKRKILRRIFGALSLTSALFVFQACYGSPRDLGDDFIIKGLVKSKSSQPIPGIKVSIENQPQYKYTDSDGKFEMYTLHASDYKLKFEDIDNTNNGVFLPKDTVVKSANGTVFITITLDGN
jgi:putative lipoprotein (rSAM/lipoprotein system)